MVKQLGLPNFFMTLSCMDLRQHKLISIIASLRGENIHGEDIQNIDFFTRCSYLNLNPVSLARHSQYRVETVFHVIAPDGPLGKVKYHAIRIEFQVFGSPHIHSFLCPNFKQRQLEKQNTIFGSVKKYIDQILNPKKCNIINPRRES